MVSLGEAIALTIDLLSDLGSKTRIVKLAYEFTSRWHIRNPIDYEIVADAVGIEGLYKTSVMGFLHVAMGYLQLDHSVMNSIVSAPTAPGLTCNCASVVLGA